MAIYKAGFAVVCVGLVMLLGAGFALLLDPSLVFQSLAQVLPGVWDGSFAAVLATYTVVVMVGIFGLCLCTVGLSIIFVELDQHHLAKRKRAMPDDGHPRLTEEQLQLQDRAWYDTLNHGKNLLGM